MCYAGTAARNYLIRVQDGILCSSYDPEGGGQRSDSQLNTLRDLELQLERLGVECPWTVQNGYVEFNDGESAARFASWAKKNENLFVELFRSHLRIGVHENVEVIGDGTASVVTQIYCSAMPIAYSEFHERFWESAKPVTTRHFTPLTPALQEAPPRPQNPSRTPKRTL